MSHRRGVRGRSARRPTTTLRSDPLSGLADRAPERRPAADRRALELRAVSAGSARRARGAGSGRPVWAPPLRIASRSRRADRAPQRVELRGRERRPPGVAGSCGARQRISSASRLPTPAITPWSSSRALTGAPPRPKRTRNVVAVDLGGVGADVREVRVRARRGRGGACRAAPCRPPSANSSAKRSQSRGASASSTTMRPAIPRCRPSSGPPSVSTHRNLPRRCVAVSRWPTSAAAISPGACGRQT